LGRLFYFDRGSLETIYLRVEKKGRRGKTVTLLEGFTRDPNEIEELVRMIKSACGTGGTVKNGYVEIQGDFRIQAAAFLKKLGFLVKGN
jgi:translation initiation factor 1